MKQLELLYDPNERYELLLKKDNTYKNDLERKALFFIIAGNIDLYEKAKYIYNFKEHSISPECIENNEVDFCSSSKALVKLAYNLYNGYSCNILEVFSNLDNENFDLAHKSILIRFNKSYSAC